MILRELIMKLLFFFDSERIYIDKYGNYYASGNFPIDVWNRYLNISDHLYVIMREGQSDITDSNILNRRECIDRTKINIHLVKDVFGSINDYLNNSLRKYNEKIVDSVIKKSDFVIIRGANRNVVRKCIQYQKPYMIEVVGSAWDALWNHGWKGKVLALPTEIVAKRVVKNAPWVLYVTNKFLQNKYPTRGKNIGVSDVSIEENAKEILKKRINYIEQRKGVITLGTAAAVNVQYKGQEYVIRALGELKKKGCIVYYELVGLGTKDYLENIAKECGVLDQVNFIGQLSHSKVLQWMDSIDIYIQPSLLEGLPRAVVEAMSRGLPVLGSDVGGIPELIEKGEIFHRKSVKEISLCIESINKEKMKFLAKSNFEKAKLYDKQALDKKRNKFYNDFKIWAYEQINTYQNQKLLEGE